MFACFPCSFHTDNVAEFADHLKAKHSSGETSETQTNDNQLLPVKQEILSSIFPTENDPLILEDPVAGDEASESDQILDKNDDSATIDDKSQLANVIKKEFDNEEELEEEEEDFYAPHFEPIIQIQVASKEEQKECESVLLEVQKKRRRTKTALKRVITVDNNQLDDNIDAEEEMPKRKKSIPKKIVPVDAEGNPVKEVKKRGRKKKPEDPNFVKRPPLKRGPKKKPESEKKHRVYPCDQCFREFKNNCDLKRHIDSTHLKLRPYKCEQCDATFALLGNLKKHIGYVHFNLKRVEKKVTCQVCGKIYSSSYCLTIHMSAMHLAEKNYQCEYCGMNFAWKRCYERHINSIHLQLKNYKCETCGMSFARKEHLKTHEKRHAREHTNK